MYKNLLYFLYFWWSRPSGKIPKLRPKQLILAVLYLFRPFSDPASFCLGSWRLEWGEALLLLPLLLLEFSRFCGDSSHRYCQSPCFPITIACTLTWLPDWQCYFRGNYYDSDYVNHCTPLHHVASKRHRLVRLNALSEVFFFCISPFLQ